VKIYVPSYQEKSKDRMELSFDHALKPETRGGPLGNRTSPVKKSIKCLLLELQKLCMSHGRRSPSIDEGPFHAGRCFQVQRKTLECFTLSDKLPSKYNRIFMHVGEGSIFITCPEFFRSLPLFTLRVCRRNRSRNLDNPIDCK
jgi:hypothetical protein